MVNGGALDRSFTEPMGEMKLANIKAIAANLHLDAHRQCFELFINAFSTYRPLLQVSDSAWREFSRLNGC